MFKKTSLFPRDGFPYPNLGYPGHLFGWLKYCVFLFVFFSFSLTCAVFFAFFSCNVLMSMFLSDPDSIIALSLDNSLTHWLFLSLIVTCHIQSLLMLMVTLNSHSLSGFLAFYQQYVSSCFLKFRIRLLLSRGAARRCTNKTWNTKHSRVDIINLIKKWRVCRCRYVSTA